MNLLPINASITVNKGAAGNTTDALCSIIRKRSTRKSEFNFTKKYSIEINNQ
jgi:hypothetical protein